MQARQSRTKLETYDKSRFFLVTELAQSQSDIELEEGVKGNLAKMNTNAVFKTQRDDSSGEVIEQKVVQQLDLYN